MSYSDKKYNAEYARNWYQRNKERLNSDPNRRVRNKKLAADWRRNNREASMLSAAKARAKRFGLPFDIELEDVVIPEMCPILGIPLAFTEGVQSAGTPALDRRDNSKGYIKGNVRVISHRANRCKSDLSIEAICNLYDYVKDLKNSA